MTTHAIMVAGTHSGAGKTIAALCIAATLKKSGYDVQPLFDGYTLSNTASSAHVAQVLNAPVIRVIDAHAVSRSTLAMFEGYKNFDSHINVVGANPL